MHYAVTLPPRFRNQCPECVYLGQFGGCDLYFCSQTALGIATVIARFADDPSSYQSGLALAEFIPSLGQAKHLAIEAGLLHVP